MTSSKKMQTTPFHQIFRLQCFSVELLEDFNPYKISNSAEVQIETTYFQNTRQPSNCSLNTPNEEIIFSLLECHPPAAFGVVLLDYTRVTCSFIL